MKGILLTLAIFLVPYVLYYGIRNCVVALMSRSLIEKALNNGIYERYGYGKGKFKVEKGLYDEYIITSIDGKESYVVSEEHLWHGLRKKNGGSTWVIASS